MTGEEETTVQDETTVEYTPRARAPSGGDGTTVAGEDESSVFQQNTAHHHARGQEGSVLSDDGGDLSGSTPRPPATKSLSMRPQFAGLDSPYEALKKRELSKAANTADDEETDTELLFQQHTARLPDMSMTPQEGRGADYDDESDSQFVTQNKNHDPLLHRMLDKNYRIMATPHKGGAGVSPIKWKVTEKLAQDVGKGKEKDKVPIWQDSPMSSPEMAVPQLRSAAFMSPVRAAYRGKTAAVSAARGAPRTPGVSVQTPATGRKTKDVYGGGREEERYTEEITWESDSDEGFGGMSPPKTIQFALPPSKLLQTPGKSPLSLLFTLWASRRLMCPGSPRGKQTNYWRYLAHRRSGSGFRGILSDNGENEPQYPRRHLLSSHESGI